jgi:hypothetical protein
MKYPIVVLSIVVFVLTMVLVISGCEKTLMAKPEIVAATTTTMAIDKTLQADLGWKDSKHPEREAWGQFLKSQLSVKHFDAFNSAKDNKAFCPKFDSLSKDQKVNMWSELLVWVIYYESGWSPTSRMVEPQSSFPKPDPITKQPVASEGLTQLSYMDVLVSPSCKMDWSKDKVLAKNDPKKTIFDPFINMDCAFIILDKQIKNKGALSLPFKHYWSVLQIGGRYGKVPQIQAKTKALPFCH